MQCVRLNWLLSRFLNAIKIIALSFHFTSKNFPEAVEQYGPDVLPDMGFVVRSTPVQLEMARGTNTAYTASVVSINCMQQVRNVSQQKNVPASAPVAADTPK